MGTFYDNVCWLEGQVARISEKQRLPVKTGEKFPCGKRNYVIMLVGLLLLDPQ